MSIELNLWMKPPFMWLQRPLLERNENRRKPRIRDQSRSEIEHGVAPKFNWSISTRVVVQTVGRVQCLHIIIGIILYKWQNFTSLPSPSIQHTGAKQVSIVVINLPLIQGGHSYTLCSASCLSSFRQLFPTQFQKVSPWYRLQWSSCSRDPPSP